MKIALLTCLAFLIALPALAQTPLVKWKVDPAKSEILFAGKNAGHEFSGKFGTWTADITFDPKNLSASAVRVEINTGSAVTGNNAYDGTLPSSIWFDSKTFPQAVFSANRFKETTPGKYEAAGSLKLKGVAQSVTVPFTVNFIGNDATMTSEFTLNRLNFGVGTASDPTGDWVSKDIQISVKVQARRTAE